jgi:hypothetical protein
MCHHSRYSAWLIGCLVKLDYDVCIEAMKPTNVARLTYVTFYFSKREKKCRLMQLVQFMIPPPTKMRAVVAEHLQTR